MIISVIGSSQPKSEEHIRLAEEVGRELARRGITLVCGGMTGLMEAACRGAKSAGGTTIGVLPGRSPREANPYVDIPIITGMGYTRNVIVVSTGRAVIAIGGAYGTLSEIGFALGYDIPVVGLKTWPLTQTGEGLPLDGLVLASDPVDAVNRAIEAAERRGDD